MASSAEINSLIAVGEAFDASKLTGYGNTQSQQNSFMHAMCDESRQTIGDCVAATNAFVAKEMAEAIRLVASDKSGALKHLGVAMHVIMDHGSPWHTDSNGNPKPWGSVKNFIDHKGEKFGGTPSSAQMESMKSALLARYQQVFKR